MTVSKMQRIWPYLLLSAVWLTLFPMIAGVVLAALKPPYEPANKLGFDFNYAYIAWGTTLFYFTWSFLLFVLLPYSLVYIYTSIKSNEFCSKTHYFLWIAGYNGTSASIRLCYRHVPV